MTWRFAWQWLQDGRRPAQVLEIELGVWQRGIVRRRKAEEEIIDFRQLARNSGRCNTQPRLTCMVQ
jgi:hypothetical protein